MSVSPSPVRRFAHLVAALACLVAGTRAQDAPGKVLSTRKISSTSGNLTAQLDEGDRFGVELAPIGDLDGNGVVDLAVGSHRDADGGTDRGAVYILFLEADGTVGSQAKISSTSGNFHGGLNDGDRFGKSVTSLGDLDGDGVPDIAVGAYRDSDVGFDRGAVWILFLNPDGTVKAHQKIDESAGGFGGVLRDGESFGWAVECLGDHDGDLVPDLAVGANRDDDGRVDAGAVWILFLNPDGTVKAEQKISATQGGFVGMLRSNNRLGTSLADLGDLDGDGVDDLAVGAFEDNDGGTWSGAVFVFFLNPDGTCKAGQKISASRGFFAGPLTSGDRFGCAVAAPGDLDGDGLPDLVVGAFEDDDGAVDAGALWVLRLNANGTVKGEQKVSLLHGLLTADLEAGDSFGTSVKSLGDFDGNGVPVVAVGAYRDDDGGADHGAVYLLGLSDGQHPAPTAALAATPPSGEVPLTVAFQDQSTGHVALRTWDFGDGTTSTEAAPSHVYTAPGTYVVTLSVEGVGGTDSAAGTVTAGLPAPTAAFECTPTSGLAPLDVAFTDLSAGDVGAWSWDFGDGSTSSAASPVHTYLAGGTYTVSLSVSGSGGTDTATAVDLVLVQEPAPVAGFSATPEFGPSPLLVSFDDLSSGAVTSWSWDFGDGTGSSAASPTHTYTTGGTYAPALTVRGPGGTDVATGTILVDPPPPAAAFGAAPTSGGAPLSVAFTDLTTGPVSAWSWDFGDGATSTAESPAHAYAAVGTYTVSLTATGPGGADTSVQADLVHVLPPPPTAAFAAAPTSGQGPLDVAFTDLSSGAIDAWSWDLGDGGTSTAASPAHTYAAVGTYTVALTVSGPGGADTWTSTGLVTVLPPPPVAVFDATPEAGTSPLKVSFTDLTSGVATSWLWSFGDGQTSTKRSPAHNYSAAGVYQAVLTASGPGGSSSASREIFVDPGPPTASFTANPTSGYAPLEVGFADTSTGHVDAWSWTFGDGATSAAEAPSHTYAAPGTYTVSLSATGFGGTDTHTEVDLVVVTEAPPAADFAATPESGQAPLQVAFTNLTTGNATSFAWDFGDGAGSTEAAPAHEYAAAGTYTVSLLATGPGGSDVRTRPGYVVVANSPPTAAFDATPTSGVAPLDVQFTDLTTGGVTGRAWDFGDGGTSTQTSPAHAYALPGTYTVSLTASGPGGADTKTSVDLIVVSEPPPVATFSGAPTSGEVPLSVAFTDLSTGTVTSWSWDFGDGATSVAASPTHLYEAVGDFDVSLTVRGPGGADTATLAGFVSVLPPPPAAAFGAAPTAGVAPLDVQFTDLSTGAVTSWSWDFGDGGTSSLASPVHTFAAAGTYTVALTAAGPGGSDADVRTGLVVVAEPPPVAAFQGAPLAGQEPLDVAFTDLSTGVVTSWSWDFGDGATSDAQAPSHAYAAPGTYTVALTVSGPGGSDAHVEVDYVTVQAVPPAAAFSAAPTSGSAPLPVTFTDLSTGTVTSWAWDFGDGGTSGEASPTHVYAAAGTYTVALTAAGPAGADTSVRTDLVVVGTATTVADFTAAPTVGNAPLDVQFTDLSSGGVASWSWDFGDGGTSSLASPLHTYETPGTYTVTLAASGPAGTDVQAQAGLVSVGGVQQGVLDPSFELQVAGTAPGAPWTVFGSHVVDPTTVASDDRMPTDGSNWLEVAATGTVAALPPSNPGGQGAPPVGGAGVQQSFRCPEGETLLSFDASYLRNGPAGSTTENDWMSVDVTDGATTWNLYYKDSFSPEPVSSSKYSALMTRVEKRSADLAVLFPGSDHATVFTLLVQIGNGGNGLRHSRGYFDDVRLDPPTADPAVELYGCGVNPEGSLVVLSGTPSIGTTIVFGVDNPLGTQPAGSATVLYLAFSPDAAYPCGTLLANYGMTGPGASGELLINTSTPDPFRTIIGPLWSGPGSPAPVPVFIPSKLNLIGVPIYVQGQVLDLNTTLGVRNALTGAIEIIVGP